MVKTIGTGKTWSLFNDIVEVGGGQCILYLSHYPISDMMEYFTSFLDRAGLEYTRTLHQGKVEIKRNKTTVFFRSISRRDFLKYLGEYKLPCKERGYRALVFFDHTVFEEYVPFVVDYFNKEKGIK